MIVDHSASMSANGLPASPPPRGNLLRRFARSRKGVTAIEFGMVGIPFLGLLCAIFETALVFFVQAAFDGAVTNVTRVIQTNGYGSTPPTTVGGFVGLVPPQGTGTSFCGYLPSFVTCNYVYLNVQSFPAGTSWTVINAAITRTFYQPNFTASYNALTSSLAVGLPSPNVCLPNPPASCIVVFQAFYAMPVYLSVLVASGTNSAANFYNKPSANVVANPSATGYVHTIFSTAVFKNEPV